MSRYFRPRVLIWILVGACAVLGLLWLAGSLQEHLVGPNSDAFLASNVIYFLLINLNIIAVMVLGFLVIKNIVKLFLDRRRQILGARLRTRLVAAFVGVSLVPTVLLFMVSRQIVSSAMQEWFSPQVGASVQGALAVGRYHYSSAEAEVYRDLRYLSRKVGELAPYLLNGEPREAEKKALEGYLSEKLAEYGLRDISIVDSRGNAVIHVSSPAAAPRAVNLAAVQQAISGALIVNPEQSPDGEVLRGYGPVATSPVSGLISGTVAQAELGSVVQNGQAQFVVVSSLWVSSDLSELLSKIVDIYDDFNEQKSYRVPLASSYLLTLVIVTLMITFAAIWVGFFLARSLAVPIQQVLEGTQEVAKGNLGYRLAESGDDEMSTLMRSFNKMTSDLEQTTGELVARRRYMETVLASVEVGVLSFDGRRRVTTCNVSAGEMLNVSDVGAVLGHPIAEVFPGAAVAKLEELVKELDEADTKFSTATMSMLERGESKHFQITATRILGDEKEAQGVVVLFDDLTELVRAQRMAAWQEVARRMAHEIKNPLTPIQLSAQRIERKLHGVAEEDVLRECTTTILKQVETLRMLVNEFSRFARLPKCEPKPIALDAVLREATALFVATHPQLEVKLELASGLPRVNADAEQMSRALGNLLENAAAAIEKAGVQSGQPRKGEIIVSSGISDDLRVVTLAVGDNGVGIPDSDKPRLFEPYFSRTKGGTGLGLAIVSSIIADHGGFIRVRDNHPYGAVFVIELPLGRWGERADRS
jgi:two-component system, NtrC family, nitrogen regulation sensor histidine kinase NtrY